MKIRLRNYSNPIDANIDKGFLENQGIESFIQEDIGSFLPGVIGAGLSPAGVSLLVDENDREKANAILIEKDENGGESG